MVWWKIQNLLLGIFQIAGDFSYLTVCSLLKVAHFDVAFPHVVQVYQDEGNNNKEEQNKGYGIAHGYFLHKHSNCEIRNLTQFCPAMILGCCVLVSRRMAVRVSIAAPTDQSGQWICRSP
jgi:hypothetical protein